MYNNLNKKQNQLADWQASKKQSKKMRRFKLETCDLFVGTKQEIKVLYKKISKAEIATPVFSDFPKFSASKKTYGLLVEWEDEEFSLPSMIVVNGDFIADLVNSGDIKLVAK